MCAYSESEVGCFRSSKGFSQATPLLRSFSPPDFAPIRRHPQQPRGSKRMLAVCRAGSKVTEVLAQYAGLSHRPSMTKSGPLDSEHLKLLQSTREKTCRSPGVRDFACTQGNVRLSAPTHGPAGTESAQVRHRCRDTTSHTSCAGHEVRYGPIPLVDNSFGPHTTPRFAKGLHPIPFLFTDSAEYLSLRYPCGRYPQIKGVFRPLRNGSRANAAAFAE